MTEGAIEVAGYLDARQVLTDEQIDLIKRTIIPGASDDELALFTNQCDRTQLDPFAKQIYCIKRWNSQAHKEVYTTQVSIDGARLVAQRSGEYAGQTDAQWCGPDGVWVDVWLKAEPPAAARVGVYRAGFVQALTAVALWDQYVVTNKDGKPNATWKKMGSLMLAKCAEMLALRRAFPMELSGLYSTEEMEQAGGTEVAVAATAEGGGGGVQPGAAVPVTTPAPPAAAKPATRRRAAPKRADVPTGVVPPTESETLKAQGKMTPQGPTAEAQAEYAGFPSDTPEERAARVEADAVAVVEEAFPGAEELGADGGPITDAEVVDADTGEITKPEPAADRLPLKQRNVVRRLLAQAGKPEDVKHLRSIVGRPDLKDVGDLSQDEYEVVVTTLTP